MSTRSTSVLTPKSLSARSSMSSTPQSPSSPVVPALHHNNLSKYLKKTQIFLPNRKAISISDHTIPSQNNTLLQQILKLSTNSKFPFCGILSKTGGSIKTVKTRFCVLKDKQLYYFPVSKNLKEGIAAEEDVLSLQMKDAKGNIQLESNTTITVGKSKSFSFFINTKERDYEFIASSDEEVQIWMNECKRELIGKNTQFYSTLITNSFIRSTSFKQTKTVAAEADDVRVITEEDITDSNYSPVLSPTLSPRSSTGRLTATPTGLGHSKRSMTQLLASATGFSDPTTPNSKSFRRSLYTGEISASDVFTLGDVPTASAILASMSYGSSVNSFQNALHNVSSVDSPQLNSELLPADLYRQIEEYSQDLDTSITISSSTPYKKQHREPYLTEEDELEVVLSAAEIFLKEEEERTVEEKAYVIAMKQYYQGLQVYLSKLKRKRNAEDALLQAEYSLASGTCLFVQMEEWMKEGKELSCEREFIDMVLTLYKDHMLKKEATKNAKLEEKLCIQKEWLETLRYTWESYKNNRQSEDAEFWKKLLECKAAIRKFENETGLKMKIDSIPSLELVMARYPQEMSFEELQTLHQLSLYM